MRRELIESFREWVHKTRRRKDWKKISTVSTVESARNSRLPIPGTESKSDEFILRLRQNETIVTSDVLLDEDED